MAYQVVEKNDFATDWAPVRYNEKALTRFETQQEAMDAAVEYLTDCNCNNALTKEEKLANTECFMMTEDGVFFGMLDGKPWFLEYPKDIMGNDSEGKPIVKHAKGDKVADRKFFMLEGKAEVAVRVLPGT